MGAVPWPQVQSCPAPWQLGGAGRRLRLLGLLVPHPESGGHNSAGFTEAVAKEIRVPMCSMGPALGLPPRV